MRIYATYCETFFFPSSFSTYTDIPAPTWHTSYRCTGLVRREGGEIVFFSRQRHFSRARALKGSKFGGFSNVLPNERYTARTRARTRASHGYSVYDFRRTQITCRRVTHLCNITTYTRTHVYIYILVCICKLVYTRDLQRRHRVPDATTSTLPPPPPH